MRKITAVLGFALLSFGAMAHSGNDVQKQIDDLKAGLHDVHMNTLQKYSESWGLEDRANIAKLQEQKLDKSVFTTDQKRQDDALKAAVKSQSDRDAGQDDHINAVQDAAQAANEKGDALAVRADGIEKQAGVLDGRVGKTAVRLDTVEGNVRDTNAQLEVTDKRSQNNAERIDGVEQVNDRQDKQIASKVDTATFVSDQERQDKALAAETDSRIAGDSYVNSRVDAANANIEANRQASVATNKRVAANTAALANHEQRIQKLESETNSRFSNMDKRIDDNKQKADAAIAGVAAMANIPQVTESARFSVGAGLGTRGSQQAVAVGFSSRLSQNVVGKLSVAADTEQQWTAGVGMAVQW